MKKIVKGAVAVALLATSSVALLQPAEAHYYGGDAALAGIVGLGVGAAIASGHHHRYYAPPPRPVYYAPPPVYGYYAPPPVYYAPPPPPYGYYRRCGWRGCW